MATHQAKALRPLKAIAREKNNKAIAREKNKK